LTSTVTSDSVWSKTVAARLEPRDGRALARSSFDAGCSKIGVCPGRVDAPGEPRRQRLEELTMRA
jgi:hypothetical protein